MGTSGSQGLKWSLQPKQLLWKLSDRVREYGQSKVLPPTAALGRRGEDLAHRYLQRAGYKVIARNYEPGEDAEIDIVAAIKDLLVFVEVKTRTAADHAAPDRNVDFDKQENIVRAARSFVSRAGADWDKVRFDIVSIVMANPPRISHNENAFHPA